MKLEGIFFKSFFYPFLAGIFLTTLILSIFLVIYTDGFYDKRISKNIIDLEKQNSKININSANVLVSTYFSKLQIYLNELILFYQKMANDLLNDENSHTFHSDYLVSAVTADEEFCDEYYYESQHMGVWVYDQYSTNENLDDSKKDIKQQLIAYSNIIPNLDIILDVTWYDASPYSFYFEKTELYITFPLYEECFFRWLGYLTEFTEIYENSTCMDEKGENYKVYKMKCQGFFINMLKSKTNTFDNNYLSHQNKTILINNFYFDMPIYEHHDLTMCIEFDDPISRGKGYACVDTNYDDLNFSLDNLNSNIKGYFFISNIGFNNVFFFPMSTTTSKIPTQYIFDWNFSFYLDEKVNFYYNIKNFFSSNYINNIGDNMNEEIYINGKNSSEQYFYANGNAFNYSIYPIIMKNINGHKEHVFNIIYVYNNEMFFEELNAYSFSMILKIIVELSINIIFGSGLLYLICLTFNKLSKYIVIPIKNVNYMLKGINIGGENRLKYLDFLKKIQDKNLEKLEKLYFLENQKNETEIELIEDSYNDTMNNYEEDNYNLLNKENINDFNKDNINSYTEIKYDEESNYIEKEYNFYDFDEQLLQYRPLEIEKLVKSLMNLKGAMILTSEDREVNKIIDYSYSEEIFRNFKNKEGINICQSNIGNLQGQLLKYDKAINHLASSLQDNKLKRFLNKNLNDEIDESDYLLNTISNYFKKDKKIEKTNILAEKQMNSIKDGFSKKKLEF